MTERPSPQEQRGPRRVYRSDAVEVHWEPRFCIHTGNCIRGLGRVFDPSARPWVDVDAADSDEIPRTGFTTTPSAAEGADEARGSDAATFRP